MRLHPQTYALTAVAHQRRRVFQRTANAELMIELLFRHRDQMRCRVHGFVVMPEHIHVVLTPDGAIERAAQLVKGGYSFAVREQFHGEVWQPGYHAHRIVDAEDYRNQLEYVADNPVKRGLADYPFVHSRYLDRLDGTPEVWAG